jgi:hypothetical protein
VAYLHHAKTGEPQKPRNMHATIELRIGSESLLGNDSINTLKPAAIEAVSQ